MRLSRGWLWFIVALLVLALLAGQSWATFRFFTARAPGGNDFFFGIWAIRLADHAHRSEHRKLVELVERECLR